MAFPEEYQVNWIRDGISIAVEEREPQLEELAEEVVGFPDKAGLYESKREWMAANSEWWDDYKNKYMFRRVTVEVAVHKECDASSIHGELLDAYIAQGATGVSLPAVIQIGTSVEGAKGNTQSDGEVPSGNYWLASYGLIDQQNGTAFITASWKRQEGWYLCEVN